MISRRRMLAGLGLTALMPRLALAETDADGFQVIRAQRAEAQLLADGKTKTQIWSLATDHQPLVIRAKQGEPVKLRFFNGLDFEIWLHFFGVRGPSDLMTINVPAGSATPTEVVFTPPDAGTFWLAPMADQSRLRDMGLYALLIVDEAVSPGDFTDLALIFDDWKIDDAGAIDQSFGDIETMVSEGRLGNWFTVNSRYRPSFVLPANKNARLRLVNTANVRTMSLLFKGGAPQVIALDGQPVTPQGLGSDALKLAPGQRVDLLLAPDHTINIALDLFEDIVEVAYLVQKGEGVPQPLTATFRLADNPTSRTPDMGAARHVAVTLEGGLKGGLAQALLNGKMTDLRGLLEHGLGWAINGAAGPGGPPLVEAKRGDTIVFDIDNRTAFEQALHINGHVWQEVDGAGGQPWRDTGLVPAKASRSFVFVADNPGAWALQSLHAERADGGLMAAFRVGE